MDGYYYKELERAEKAAYEQMKTGLEALAPSIRVVRLESERLAEVYLRLKLDTPMLFYVVGYSYRYYPGADHVELIPEYLFEKSKIRTHQQAISARMQRLVRPLQGKSQLEKELAIHDFILENVRYDKLKKSYSHEIIGPMTQGVGVCEGIAKTVKALCDAVGVECIIALSEANPERGVRYRHTWNILTIDGKRYHLDATFDNSLQRGVKRYDYFNLDDRHIFLDHEKLVLPVPACGCGKPGAPGPAKEAGAFCVSLAGRRAEPGDTGGPAGPGGGAGREEGLGRKLRGECAAGGDPAGLRRGQGDGGAAAG